MKKIFASFLTALLLFSVVGCGGPSKETKEFAKQFNQATIQMFAYKHEMKRLDKILKKHSDLNTSQGYYEWKSQRKTAAEKYNKLFMQVVAMQDDPLFDKADKAGLIKFDDYEKMDVKQLLDAYHSL